MVDDLQVFATRFDLAMDMKPIRAACGFAPPARLLFTIQSALFQSVFAALLRARDRPGKRRASVPALLRLLEDREVHRHLMTLRWKKLYPDAESTMSPKSIGRAVDDLKAAFETIEAQEGTRCVAFASTRSRMPTPVGPKARRGRPTAKSVP